MDQNLTGNPNLVREIRKKWSHDDLLIPQIQKWSVLTENGS